MDAHEFEGEMLTEQEVSARREARAALGRAGDLYRDLAAMDPGLDPMDFMRTLVDGMGVDA